MSYDPTFCRDMFFARYSVDTAIKFRDEARDEPNFFIRDTRKQQKSREYLRLLEYFGEPPCTLKDSFQRFHYFIKERVACSVRERKVRSMLADITRLLPDPPGPERSWLVGWLVGSGVPEFVRYVSLGPTIGRERDSVFDSGPRFQKDSSDIENPGMESIVDGRRREIRGGVSVSGVCCGAWRVIKVGGHPESGSLGNSVGKPMKGGRNRCMKKDYITEPV